MTQPFSATAARATYRAWTVARRWSASIALLAFQVTPVAVKQTADGKFDVSVGFTADQYLQESFGCDGSKLSERSVQSKVVSAIFDYMPKDDMRFSGFVGGASSTAGECSSGVVVNCRFGPPFSGGFAGAQFSHERRRLGLGLGIATLPEGTYAENSDGVTSHVVRPTFYARFGNREKQYVRLDVNNVRTPGQVPMLLTLGVGVGRPGYHAERGFIGIGFLPYSDVGTDAPTVITGNIAIPVANYGDVLIGGYAGAGESRGATIGARLHLSGGK